MVARRPGAWLGLTLLLLLLALPATTRATGQVEMVIDPALTRGPAGAPVTIVEFSDYQ